MLTNTEIRELIFSLLDCRKKLLWVIDHDPISNKQRELIEESKRLLKRANQMLLEEFQVELPT